MKDHKFDFSVSWPIPALQPRGPTKRISMDLLLDVGLHWCRPSESILLFGVESRGALKCWSWLLFCNGSKTHVSEVFPRVFANGKVLHKTGEWGEVYSTEAISSFCVGLSHTHHQSSSSLSSFSLLLSSSSRTIPMIVSAPSLKPARLEDFPGSCKQWDWLPRYCLAGFTTVMLLWLLLLLEDWVVKRCEGSASGFYGWSRQTSAL